MYELNGLTMYYCDEVQTLTSCTLFSALWSQMQHNVQHTSETLKIIKQLFYRQSVNSGTVFFLPIKFQFYYLTGKKIYLGSYFVWFGSLAQHKVINHSELF